jgi:hypothetical protein
MDRVGCKDLENDMTQFSLVRLRECCFMKLELSFDGGESSFAALEQLPLIDVMMRIQSISRSPTRHHSRNHHDVSSHGLLPSRRRARQE